MVNSQISNDIIKEVLSNRNEIVINFTNVKYAAFKKYQSLRNNNLDQWKKNVQITHAVHPDQYDTWT